MTNLWYVFFTTPELLKIASDHTAISGITHTFLHGYSYSPREAPFPGWIRYGTLFSERNTWWKYLDGFLKYNARLSALFQSAQPRTGIAILHPFSDIWSRYGLQRQPVPRDIHPEYQYTLWEAIHKNGNGCDYISENLINGSEFRDGKLICHGRQYHTLMLMEQETLVPETATKLLEFAGEDGRILFTGRAPSRSPGFAHAPENDRTVREAISGILKEHAGRCRIIPAPGKDVIGWFAGIQKEQQLEPFIRIKNPDVNVSHIHYQKDGKDIFFLANKHKIRKVTLEAVFNTGDKTPWLWDPETGERKIFPYNGKKNALTLHFEPAGSFLLVFEPAPESASESVPEPAPGIAMPAGKPPSSILILDGSWELTLMHINGNRDQLVLNKLTNFRDLKELRSFAGTAVYEKTFSAEHSGKTGKIDLGQVYGISEVELNGKNLGFRWYGNHIYSLNGALNTGKNRIRVSVTTTLGNYCLSLKDNKVAQKWIRGRKVHPAGLTGPVRILE